MIDSYSFGLIVIDGTRYTSDLIIFPHRVKGGWWRKHSHQVHPEDLSEVILEKPEILVIGTGAEGLVQVLPETQRYLDSHGIVLIAEATEEACRTYNRLNQSQKVVAAFHLTC